MKSKFKSFLPYLLVGIGLSLIKVKTDYKPEDSEEFRKFTEGIHKDFENEAKRRFEKFTK